MATGPRYNVAFRRRREMRTDYYVRRKLLRGGETRAIVRRSNKNIMIQFADFDMGGDLIVASATSRELKALGWDKSCSSIPAAYLTGYLAGKKAVKAAHHRCLDGNTDYRKGSVSCKHAAKMCRFSCCRDDYFKSVFYGI